MNYAHVATFNGVHWVRDSNYCLWVQNNAFKAYFRTFLFFNVLFINCFEQRSPIAFDFFEKAFSIAILINLSIFKSYVAQSKYHIAWSNLAGV